MWIHCKIKMIKKENNAFTKNNKYFILILKSFIN